MDADTLAKLTVIRYLNICEQDAEDDKIGFARHLLEDAWGLKKVRIPLIQPLNETVQNIKYDHDASMELLKEAEKAADANEKPPSVLNKFKEVIAKDPLNIECHIMQAKYLMKIQNWKQAVFDLELAILLNPHQKEAYQLLCTTYFMCDDLKSAKEVEERAQKYFPDFSVKFEPTTPGLQERTLEYVNFLQQGDNFEKMKEIMKKHKESGHDSIEEMMQDPEMMAFCEMMNAFADDQSHN